MIRLVQVPRIVTTRVLWRDRLLFRGCYTLPCLHQIGHGDNLVLDLVWSNRRLGGEFHGQLVGYTGG